MPNDLGETKGNQEESHKGLRERRQKELGEGEIFLLPASAEGRNEVEAPFSSLVMV